MAYNQMQGMNGLSGGMNPGGFNQPLPMGQPQKQRSGIGEFFLGNRGGFSQVPKYNQQQSDAYSQLLQQSLGMLNPQAIEQQATNRFNQQTVPGLAERFTSMGQGRASSPAFASQLGQAGAGMNVDLQALLSQLGTQLLPYGLKEQYETNYQKGSPGLLENIFSSLLENAGLLGGQAAGQAAQSGGKPGGKGGMDIEKIVAMLAGAL